LWQVPIQVMGEGAVPGGQEWDDPPQQEHRKPSIAQYFQYSQLSGLSSAALDGAFAAMPGPVAAAGAAPFVAAACADAAASDAAARLDRSIGSSGSNAAPVSMRPRAARTLRREVRCASEREDCSKSRSMERTVMPSGIQKKP
jgi:hypothetical protein